MKRNRNIAILGMLIGLGTAVAAFALDFTETTDFLGGINFTFGPSVGTLDPGANTVSGSLRGNCVVSIFSPIDCNTGHPVDGDTQDSFNLTVPAGYQITSLTVTTSNFFGPNGFDATIEVDKAPSPPLNTVIPVTNLTANGPTANLVTTPLGEGVYAISVFGQRASALGAYSLSWSVTINLAPIGGSSGSFQTGTFIRLTQKTLCCFNVVVDDDDHIFGGIGKTPTWGGTGSTMGQNWATAKFTKITLDPTVMPPLVTNNGPSVGAFSFSNQGTGFGRAIAFATFRNNSSTTHLRAHADLSGEFLQAWFGLPNGFLAAGAAIHVFDTDKFNAAISGATDGSDAAIGKFLLNGYTAESGLTPSVGILNLDTVLASARIGRADKYYNNGPFNPPSPISDSLNAPFTIDIGKNYTVVFDVVASGIVEGTPEWAIGTGQVNFADTLKPSPTFFTDDNGNPVSGIGVVGELPSLPAGPVTLTLAPTTGTAQMEHAYTVTAAAKDSNSQPVAGSSVKFVVKTGPNQGISTVAITDANGNASFTYTGKGGAGTDTIQANTGSVLSNSVSVTWQVATCPQGQGFWKNHANAWPVASLVLGSEQYSKAELLNLLNNPGGGDASMILAVQLIAAKLSIQAGSDPRPILSVGANADNLLGGFTGKLPYSVKPGTSAGQSMTQAASQLGSYNNGNLTRGCIP
jgi:hypothetical protein